MIGTLDDFKAWATMRGYVTDDFDDDALTASLVYASSRLVDLCRRTLEVGDADTEYIVMGNDRQTVMILECVSVTSVKLNGVALTHLTDWVEVTLNEPPFWGLRRVGTGDTWLSSDSITINAKLGYTDPVPEALVEAAYLIASERTIAADEQGISSIAVHGVSATLSSQKTGSKLEDLIAPHVKVV